MTRFEGVIARTLSGLDFPADQVELIEQAKANDAPEEAIRAIESLNWHTFGTASDVIEAFDAGLVKGEARSG
jgi:hypothetical protein